MSHEKVLPGFLVPANSKEDREIRRWKAPTPHRIAFKRRVFEIEEWASRQGLIEENELVRYIEVRYGLERAQALVYFSEVIKDFRRMNKVYGGNKK